MFSIEIEADENGELMLEFPDELMEALDWQPGDTITWKENKNGSWTLRKKKTIKPEDNDNEY
jgi:hypothetical protein